MSDLKFLFVNGIVSRPSDTPPVTTLLETHPGAYTTSRTHSNGSILLFWDRHLSRLANSARVLFNSNPELLFKTENPRVPFLVQFSMWDSMIRSLVDDSMRKALPLALKERENGEELAVTTLVSGNLENLSGKENVDEERISRVFDVYVHVGVYVPLSFGMKENGAHLAMVGSGRVAANTKYADWVRLRKHLEKLRPPYATEILLSNDGDHILEGCLTNVFVVCHQDDTEDDNEAEEMDSHGHKSACNVEIQTAPTTDGVLPGVLRQVIIEALDLWWRGH